MPANCDHGVPPACLHATTQPQALRHVRAGPPSCSAQPGQVHGQLRGGADDLVGAGDVDLSQVCRPIKGRAHRAGLGDRVGACHAWQPCITDGHVDAGDVHSNQVRQGWGGQARPSTLLLLLSGGVGEVGLGTLADVHRVVRYSCDWCPAAGRCGGIWRVSLCPQLPLAHATPASPALSVVRREACGTCSHQAPSLR